MPSPVIAIPPTLWVEAGGLLTVLACLAVHVTTLRYARRAYLAIRRSGERNGGLLWARYHLHTEAALCAAQALSVAGSLLRMADWRRWPPDPWAAYHLLGWVRVLMSVCIAASVALSLRASRKLRDGR